MKERSGIDMIEELLAEVKRLNKKVDVMDRLLKKVANSTKISEIATKALNTPLKEWAKPGNKTIEAFSKDDTEKVKKGKRFKFEPTDASKIKKVAPNRAAKQDTKCMCSGKMVVSDGGRSVPLPGISVKLFNDKDEIIKKTKTNKAGLWQAQLPVGRYVALIEGKLGGADLYPVNINFEVKPGDKVKKVE